LTDNQAGYKEQVFDYVRAGQSHDLLLVSTVDGKPQYAYFDGAKVPAGQLDTICRVINAHKTVPMSPSSGTDHSGDNYAKEAYLSQKADSIQRIMRRMERAGITNDRIDGRAVVLADLKHEYDGIMTESKDLAMKEYSTEAKYIPIDVKLHDLLTKIIVNGEYTPGQRVQLNALIKDRLSI
jgi:hypothetical protein